MEIQRLRNLTTGILHTEIGHIYEDIEILTGEKGIMTHMLPRACEAMMPILGERLKKVENSERFFNGKWDKEHMGEVDMPPFAAHEKAVFWDTYRALPSLLDKIGSKQKVVEVLVDRELNTPKPSNPAN